MTPINPFLTFLLRHIFMARNISRFVVSLRTRLCKSIIRIECFNGIDLTLTTCMNKMKLFHFVGVEMVILNSADWQEKKRKINDRKSFPMLFNSLQKWNTIVIFSSIFSHSLPVNLWLFRSYLFYVEVTSPFTKWILFYRLEAQFG